MYNLFAYVYNFLLTVDIVGVVVVGVVAFSVYLWAWNFLYVCVCVCVCGTCFLTLLVNFLVSFGHYLSFSALLCCPACAFFFPLKFLNFVKQNTNQFYNPSIGFFFLSPKNKNYNDINTTSQQKKRENNGLHSIELFVLGSSLNDIFYLAVSLSLFAVSVSVDIWIYVYKYIYKVYFLR